MQNELMLYMAASGDTNNASHHLTDWGMGTWALMLFLAVVLVPVSTCLGLLVAEWAEGSGHIDRSSKFAVNVGFLVVGMVLFWLVSWQLRRHFENGWVGFLLMAAIAVAGLVGAYMLGDLVLETDRGLKVVGVVYLILFVIQSAFDSLTRFASSIPTSLGGALALLAFGVGVMYLMVNERA